MSVRKTRVGYLQLPVPSKDIPTVVTDLRALGVAGLVEQPASPEQVAAVSAKVEAARAALVRGRERTSTSPSRRLTEVQQLDRLVADPALAKTMVDPVPAGKAGTPQRTWMLRGVLLLVVATALGLGGHRAASSKGPAVASLQTRKVPGVPKVREPARVAASPASAAVVTAPPEQAAEPVQAARSFALGAYAEALRQYRFLARTQPEQATYALMVRVLSAREREH